jgi:hypothetical protein
MVKALAMTHTDNSSFLAQANARRHQAALSAARHAIEQLQRQGKPVNFSAIAQTAGVSRGWLYRQDQIRDIIGRLRRLDPPGSQPNGQAPNRYASGSMPPAPRSPACEPRTTPSASRSPATSACSEPAAKPSRAAVTRPRPLPTAPATTCLHRQKHLSTRHYLQTTPDNRRYALHELFGASERRSRRTGGYGHAGRWPYFYCAPSVMPDTCADRRSGWSSRRPRCCGGRGARPSVRHQPVRGEAGAGQAWPAGRRRP